MITNQARDSFNLILDKSIKSCLSGKGQAGCEIEAVEVADIKSRKMIVLTMSSYQFRILLFVHFTNDKSTLAHFAGNDIVESISHDTALDVIMESCNMCCGAISRDLHVFYPHIGMSTPSVLDGDSRGFMDTLGSGYARHVRVKFDNGASLWVSLVACEQVTMDFAVVETQAEEESAGELEFF